MDILSNNKTNISLYTRVRRENTFIWSSLILMDTSGLESIIVSLFPILFISVMIIIVTANVRRTSKIKKLKSGEMPSKEIKWIVSEIKYTPPWKNDSWIIKSRYIIAKATNPVTNDEVEYESDTMPYEESWFKIRWMWPTEEDKQKVFEYARTFIKEWDTVKIHTSMENADLYYIEDITKGKEASTKWENIENKWDIQNNIIELGKSIGLTWGWINVFWWNIGSWISKNIKKFKTYTSVAIWIVVGVPILVSLLKDNNWVNLSLPKIDWGIHLNMWWSYILRSILALLVGFIIYKVIVWYRGIKK